MILPQTYLGALVSLILGMICLGLWANSLKMAGRLRFELFYFDFALGVSLAALVYSFTVGDMGYDGFSLLDDLSKAGKSQWLFGFLAGVIFNIGNMLLTAAISVAGMSVAFPVALGVALLAMVIAGPRASSPTFLILGCALIVAAMASAVVAYRHLIDRRRAALAGQARLKKGQGPSAVKGLVLAGIGGLPLGLFFLMLNKARLGELGLGPYSSMLVFAAGLFFSTCVFNLFFMNLPVEGEPLEVTDYLKPRAQVHLMGLAGGIVWCTGFLAIQVATSLDPAIQAGAFARIALSHGGAVIATLCGLLVWREFGEAGGAGKAAAFGAVVLFAGGLLVLASAFQV